ncbi:MAG: sulfite exporter TauE/SafE family protein [Lentisphaeria bacterium]|nr:sulfite exporter TauE/SafE family protein [Lentisphaeria bacterium]
MRTIFDIYSSTQLIWVAVSIFLMGMGKGGFPIGAVALPLLVLVWPEQAGDTKKVAAFMLPMLCVMDCFAVGFYRNHIDWRRVLPLVPMAVLGVATASVLFLFGDSFVHLSDRWLKLMIGLIGLMFVAYQICRKLILNRLSDSEPTRRKAHGFGFSAGVTSTLAHAAAPLAQMYFLPQGLGKMTLAASMAGFFFILNLVKVIPYFFSGQFTREGMTLCAMMLPLIPVGVAAGFTSVRMMKGDTYRLFIHIILFCTSCVLIQRALAG